ncbi:CPBP family intramembrane glutamic endopeptidase [Clostridium folliculivorans]|uniref:CAAX prenyl protease 2/Lysostaphin resistance protein A-like domain-containing protein n=1 Tax=Clostridium folliculivorans TaxID=2886038 RepID=A0A9W6DAL1_9CLOT|nr:type II CAAX endopeptidase family protein [Clostridium folliculivorans]GKU24932.1 hypothetical protein CFOLD11_17580 [Clostridium folliculivorans]GKU31030.1 hypothetical protein CFB3_31370 [Clostridium folliculivorans]
MSKETIIQIKFLAAPIIWQVIYLFISGGFTKENRVYCDLIFYFVLAVYFISIGYISFKKLFEQWKSGKSFWIQVLWTAISLTLAFGLGVVVSLLFPNVDDGMGVFRVTNIPSLIAFIFTTIIFPPIAEEAFYRKAIVNFENRKFLIISSILGVILFSLEHSLKLLGLLTAAIWAVPLTLSYIKTKNIYIPMTAHFICNLLVNGFGVIAIMTRLILR